MTPLETLIREMIVETGPISIEIYMKLALGHLEHGYYTSKMPLGESGDFITAPEISQMFGELIGLWCVAVWRAMGAPRPFLLVELGPGRGSLMADALRATKIAPDFLSAIDLHLVETSEILRRSQRAALAASGLVPKWHTSVEDLPAGPMIIIANEFFDCLPVRHFVRGVDGWHERLVGLDGTGQLCFGLAPGPDPGLAMPGEPGEVLEAGFAAMHVMAGLAARLAAQGGALLAIDYGYDGPPRGETLQAVQRHRFADPLADPGGADLTAHVDFRNLARAARASGAAVHGPVPQGEFLARLGLHERAVALRKRANARQCAAIDAALDRLAGDGTAAGSASMARLFKALAVTAPGLDVPPGFEGAA
ncbi:SAM-dependent methyltransferase [Methylocapsa sp. D3K7]|uniref:class I SAM-dependent methyltransferase n=1 Tax=Methylocapsa sp. D3K7 TaxID=3041435 RepID=UPI00244EEF07|nr:SAM-dependent methyltransferase [Methylocapsa sp. D3K7]WGJ13971.1 SAM-dependent methyltransferase [Methylocapsa sp. D3K7]